MQIMRSVSRQTKDERQRTNRADHEPIERPLAVVRFNSNRRRSNESPLAVVWIISRKGFDFDQEEKHGASVVQE